MPKVREHQLELPSLALLTADIQSLAQEIAQARGAYPSLGARLDSIRAIRREIVALPVVMTPEVAPGSSYAGEIPVLEPVVVVVRVSVVPQAPVSGFRLELFGDPARTAVMYRFDTSRMGDYAAGSAVFDPEAGYDAIPMRNLDGAGKLYYTVWNDDAGTASVFSISLEVEQIMFGS